MRRFYQRPGRLLLVLAFVLACTKKSPAPSGIEERAGIRVPLPAGWSFRAASERLLLVGTQEHSVMRIEVLAGSETLPPPGALAAEFVRHLRGISSRIEREQAKADTSLVLLELKPSGTSKGKAEPVFLGAKRIGHDLFLCATEPGVNVEEVRVAEGACHGLSASAAD